MTECKVIPIRKAPIHTAEVLECPNCNGRAFELLISTFPINKDSNFCSADIECACGHIFTVGMVFPTEEGED